MYRDRAEPRPRGEIVTIRTYIDPMGAELDRAHLSAQGITAYVIESGAFAPGVTAFARVRLQVDEHDASRAEAILAVMAPEESEGDDEDPGAVRCPECELPYCSFRRPTGRPTARKRWHCDKCSHVWDDDKAGPREITRLEADDVRPVFRLRRSSPGMGLLLGAIVGFFAAVALGAWIGGPLAVLAALVAIVGGWQIGGALRYDVCSVPDCRAPLPSGEEDCPRCSGHIAGVIHSAAEHFSTAASFRRELAAERAAAAKRKKRRRAKTPT